ncbi:hypothetical protein EJB05_40467, partial [Eragrostis curvula]
MLRLSITKLGLPPISRMSYKLAELFQRTMCILLFGIFFIRSKLGGVMPWRRLSAIHFLFLLLKPRLLLNLLIILMRLSGAEFFLSASSLRMRMSPFELVFAESVGSSDFSLSEFATPKASSDVVSGKCVTPESSSDVSLSEFATPEPSSHKLSRNEPPIEIFSSPSEIELSSESDPLSPVEGGGGPFTFPPGSLVAIGRVYQPDSDASEGRRGRAKRGSRGCRPRGGSSSSRVTAKKKGGGLHCRDSSVDPEGPSSHFDAASHVERMLSSGVVDPVFRRPYSPSSGYDVDEFSIVYHMLLELGLIVKQEPDDGSP